MKKIIAIWLVLSLVLSGCAKSPTGNVPAVDSVKEFMKEDLPIAVAKLQPINFASVENFERYKTFADRLNSLIKILNEQGDIFNIPSFQPTQSGWEKASRFITEYSPLIDNYNEVVLAAKNFEAKRDKESLKDFYLCSGKFAFEATLIIGAVFYSAAYQTVGFAYRASGLNRLAFTCSSCVSVILGNAHWFIRGVMVEGTSQIAKEIADDAIEAYEKAGGIEGIKQKTKALWEDMKTKINETIPYHNP